MRTILVMDDEEDIQDLLKIYLEKQGFKVFTAFTGEEVLELFREGKTIDIAVLDLHINEGMGGIETLKKMKTEGFADSVKVVLSSGTSIDPSIKNQYKDMGFIDLILKPYLLTNFIEKINSIINQ